jgi:hypothetical protein
MVLIITKTRFQIIKLQWPRGCRLFQLGQLFHYEYDFQLVLQKLNPQYFFLHEASLQLTNEHTGISGEKKISEYQTLQSQGLIKFTSTILAHCVPLPAPGPPKTKTTFGNSSDMIDLM